MSNWSKPTIHIFSNDNFHLQPLENLNITKLEFKGIIDPIIGLLTEDLNIAKLEFKEDSNIYDKPLIAFVYNQIGI